MSEETRANELYWDSDLSVNQIAEEMDLSKGMLYGLIQAQPAGSACPLCGDEVAYPNRTAKERGQVTCDACGWDGELEDAGPASADMRRRRRGTHDPDSDDLDADDLDSDDLDSDMGETKRTGMKPPLSTHADHHRGRFIAGGALLGAAAGLALVFWARRR